MHKDISSLFEQMIKNFPDEDLPGLFKTVVGDYEELLRSERPEVRRVAGKNVLKGFYLGLKVAHEENKTSAFVFFYNQLTEKDVFTQKYINKIFQKEEIQKHKMLNHWFGMSFQEIDTLLLKNKKFNILNNILEIKKIKNENIGGKNDGFHQVLNFDFKSITTEEYLLFLKATHEKSFLKGKKFNQLFKHQNDFVAIAPFEMWQKMPNNYFNENALIATFEMGVKTPFLDGSQIEQKIDYLLLKYDLNHHLGIFYYLHENFSTIVKEEHLNNLLENHSLWEDQLIPARLMGVKNSYHDLVNFSHSVMGYYFEKCFKSALELLPWEKSFILKGYEEDSENVFECLNRCMQTNPGKKEQQVFDWLKNHHESTVFNSIVSTKSQEEIVRSFNITP